ncbi:MAG: hypothetical protein R3284_02485 [Rubricoccaceae bacterium]|nr:hypothetical protein [Rubricoccaceae bacterium]
MILSISLLVVTLLVLAILSLGMAVYGWTRKKQIAREKARLEAMREMDPDDELKSLGISAVRPASDEPEKRMRTPGHSESGAVRSEEADGTGDLFSSRPSPQTGDGMSTPIEEQDGVYLEIGGSATAPYDPSTFLTRGSPLWGKGKADARAVAFLLESAWASLAAQSVALLRFDTETAEYVVDALVGNGTSRNADLFTFKSNVLDEVADDGAISLLNEASFSVLVYYEKPEEVVGCAAVVAVHGPDARVVMVADRPKNAPEFAQSKCDLLGDYADMLGRILLDEEGYTTPLRQRFDVLQEEPPEDAEDVQDLKFDEGEKPRRRADIIKEEMELARRHERPMALALVVPRDADQLLKQGGAIVARRRKEMMDLLSTVEGSSRVEQFGDLMAGVFCRVGPAFVESWAERVEESDPNLIMGVALLRARHDDPESLRADASTALREAYEREEDCVIID